VETMIYSPLEDYENRLRALHEDNTQKFFEELVQKSGVDIAQNRKTVKEYDTQKENLRKLKRKLGWWRFFRVLMCLTVILIPLVIWKMTPAIRKLRQEIQEGDRKTEELLNRAYQQMQPLNDLFTRKDALHLLEKTMPLLRFQDYLSVEQETDMRVNYDFPDFSEAEESTVDVLAGHYNENPFLFENKLIHTMGMETYHGYKTIYWTERYRDSQGKMQTRTRSQTLHATVVKPKPFYNTRVILNYCSQGGPDLSFSRDATHLEQKSDREIERMVKRGEKKLKKKTDKAIKRNEDFQSMSNTDFEVMFDALDRTNEVQFRTLFTPLAQTNMVDLIRSQTGYGDDFNFVKIKRTNRIVTQHSQGRLLNLLPRHYTSHSYDITRENFLGKNREYFKAVYFDFAPLLAIPVYQERPVHSLKPIPDQAQLYALKECEALANLADKSYMVHPNTKTKAILKSTFVHSQNNVDEACVKAYSYDIEPRVDVVPVLGGDGKMHGVPVPWDLYLPLEAENHFCITTDEIAGSRTVLARHNGLCIFES